MKIVVEYSFVISFIAGFITFSLVGKLTKQKVRFKFLACCFYSVISLIYPLFQMRSVIKILLLVFSMNINVLILYKFVNFFNFLRNILLIFIFTCLFGGICDGIKNLIGDFSLFIVSIILIVSYLLVKCVLFSLEKSNKIKQFTFKIKIIDNGKEIEEEAYLDSGNVLRDNVTKKPIILINYDIFNRLYSEINYICAITKQYNFKDFKLGHFVPINGVTGGNKILVFCIDEMWIGEDKYFKDVMVGLSFSGFEKNFGKNVLLNSEMI